MKIVLMLMLFSIASLSFAQDTVEYVAESSCSLSVKTSVMPVDSMDRTGKVQIDALLTDKHGNPIEGQDIKMSATSGTLTCMPPLSFVRTELPQGTEGCLRTQEDGTIKIYLVNIPFNRPGQVKAFCTYGNFKVHAVGTYVIKKFVKTTTKSKRKKYSSLSGAEE